PTPITGSLKCQSYGGCKLVQWNCTNILHSARVYVLKEFALQNEPYIIALQESRASDIFLDGFQLEESQEALTSMYVKNNIPYVRRPDIEGKLPLASVVVTVKTEKSNLTIANIYLNPNARAHDDLPAIFRLEEEEDILILGDFNSVGRTCASSSKTTTTHGSILDDLIDKSSLRVISPENYTFYRNGYA